MRFKSLRRQSLSIFASLITAACAVGVTAPLLAKLYAAQSGIIRADEAQQVSNYLQSLNLETLRIRHLEMRLGEELDPERRLVLAQQLAQLYTGRLMATNSEAAERAHDWRAASENLIQLYPSIEMGSLRVAILHARYVSAENAFRGWWNSGMSAQDRSVMGGDFRQLVDELEQANRQIEAAYQKLAIPAASDGGFGASRAAQLESIMLHSNYLLGWAYYFRAVIEAAETEQRSRWFEASEENFRAVLQIESKKPIRELPVAWIDLDSAWNVRAMIGLAMSLQGQGQLQDSQYCFELVRQNAPQTSEIDALPIWQLSSCLYLGLWEPAVQIVDQFNSSSNTAGAGDQSQVNFWIAAIRAAAAIKEQLPDTSARLLRPALAALTRKMQASVIIGLLDELKIEIPGNDFLAGWVTGYLLFYAAEQSGKDDDFVTAQRKLQQALEEETAAANNNDRARCQFLVAWIDLQLRQFDLAALSFAQVTGLLREIDPPLAAQAQWLRVQALTELAHADARHNNAAFAAMNQMLLMFPESPQSRRIEFEKLRLTTHALPKHEAVRRLTAIDPDDPNYEQALFELVNTQYQIWLEVYQSIATAGQGTETNQRQQSAAAEQQHFQRLVQWARQLEVLPGSAPQRRMKALLLCLDASLKRQSEHYRQFLTDAARIADELEDRNGQLFSELRYYEFQVADKDGNTAAAEQIAQRLAEDAQAKNFQLSALIWLARHYDQRLKDSGSATDAIRQSAIQTYQRLLALLGADLNLQSSANARVATARLAALYNEVGRPGDAEPLYELLLQSFPDHSDYLRDAAVTKMSLSDVQSARPLWSKLAGGVQAGTDLWYEAKYNLIVCLAKSDKQAAARVYRQTLQLSAGLPVKWQQPYLDLAPLINTQ